MLKYNYPNYPNLIYMFSKSKYILYALNNGKSVFLCTIMLQVWNFNLRINQENDKWPWKIVRTKSMYISLYMVIARSQLSMHNCMDIVCSEFYASLHINYGGLVIECLFLESYDWMLIILYYTQTRPIVMIQYKWQVY